MSITVTSLAKEEGLFDPGYLSNLNFSNLSSKGITKVLLPTLTLTGVPSILNLANRKAAKIGIRNHRKDAIDMVKELKNDGLSEDLAKDAETEVQNITNSFSPKVDDLLAIKEKEIMTI